MLFFKIFIQCSEPDKVPVMSKREVFVIKINDFRPLANVTMDLVLDIAGVQLHFWC